MLDNECTPNAVYLFSCRPAPMATIIPLAGSQKQSIAPRRRFENEGTSTVDVACASTSGSRVFAMLSAWL
ncbi:hypothetical protein ACLOJK_014506 [Asimina triloba]